MKRICSSFCSCSSSSSIPPGCRGHFQEPPTYPFEDPQFKEANPIPKGLDADFPVPLTLLPGDTITVRSNSQENAEYEGLIIDDEGKVHVPIAGAVQVSGLSPHQAERTIEGVLQKYDRFVRVSVVVTGWGGHFATVIGRWSTKVQDLSRACASRSIAAAAVRCGSNEGELKYLADLDGARRIARIGGADHIRLALSGDPKHTCWCTRAISCS